MKIPVELDFFDWQGKAILEEAKAQGKTAGEVVNSIFEEFDLLMNDGLLDYLDNLADKYNIEIPDEDEEE